MGTHPVIKKKQPKKTVNFVNYFDRNNERRVKRIYFRMSKKDLKSTTITFNCSETYNHDL